MIKNKTKCNVILVDQQKKHMHVGFQVRVKGKRVEAGWKKLEIDPKYTCAESVFNRAALQGDDKRRSNEGH